MSGCRFSYANVTSTVAVVLTLGAATATAATIITGANIKDGSVTGVDIADNSLTGTDINEAALGIVPNSAKIGGQTATDIGSRIYTTDGGGLSYYLGDPADPISATVAQLTLPAGNYAATGKAEVGAQSPTTIRSNVLCLLDAGWAPSTSEQRTLDQADVSVDPFTPNTGDSQDSTSLAVAAGFRVPAGGGVLGLYCETSGESGSGVVVSHVRLNAVRGLSLVTQ